MSKTGGQADCCCGFAAAALLIGKGNNDRFEQSQKNSSLRASIEVASMAVYCYASILCKRI